MTKVATIQMRKSLSLVMVAALIVTALLVALMPRGASAADTDTMDGSFTLGNSAPTIDQVIVVAATDNGTPVTSVTPQLSYWVKVQVTDANTLADLTTCNVTLFYDADDDDDAGDIPSENTTHAAKISLNENTSAFTLTPAATTWAEGGDSWRAGATAQQGWLIFDFFVGKIAWQAADNWDVYVSVQDDEGGTDTEYSAKDLTMNFYGEVTTSDSVAFGSVTAGSTYADNKVTDKEVNYICNGPYDEQVAASSAWGTGTLDTADSPGANEFCLKANDEDVLGTAVQVNTTASYTTMDDTGVITSESGDDVITNTLWLRVGSPFASGTYNGTIYFKVINGS